MQSITAGTLRGLLELLDPSVRNLMKKILSLNIFPEKEHTSWPWNPISRADLQASR